MNKIELVDNICFISIDNKPNNLLNKPEFIAPDVLQKFAGDDNCKSILIHSTGRNFSAGADISVIFNMLRNGELADELNKGKKLLKQILSYNIPVIAAIEGVCFGGGLEIVLNADIKIASEKALFAFPEANHELMPGLGGTQNLTKVVGKARAIEIILKADTINSIIAKELGIIDNIVEAKSTMNYGIELCNKLVSNRPVDVIRAIVQSIRNVETMEYEKALEEETILFCKLAEKVSVEDDL